MIAGCGGRSTPGVQQDASLMDGGDVDASDARPKDIDADTPEDIGELLSSIPTMTVEESSTNVAGYRYFLLSMTQPVDHEDPESGTFRQHMTLLHRSVDGPMVLVTAGYWNYWRDYRIEPTRLFEANQLVVEHRFFGDSVPQPRPWDLLNIYQAASDLHRVVEAVRPLYSGGWISAGASKGGMSAVYFRRFYPDDVDGTLAYVAPISFAAPDARYISFLQNVGHASCRDGLRSFQIEALSRRAAMMDRLSLLADERGLEYTFIEGLETAFEVTVLAVPFTFWQYYGVDYCSTIPPVTASDEQFFLFLKDYVGFEHSSDESLEVFIPYYYQAHTELGYPDVDISHLEDMLITEVTNPERGVLPHDLVEPVTFDPAVMNDIASWVESRENGLMFVYGEYDPWTAGAFSLGDGSESYLYVVDEGSHFASIGDLPQHEQQAAIEVLRNWLGITSSFDMYRSFTDEVHYPGHLFARDEVFGLGR